MRRYRYFYLMRFVLIFALSSLTWSHPPLETLNGKPLPAFYLPSLMLSKKHFSSEDLKGHVSVLNIWASWCYACFAEHDLLMEIKKKNSILLYGINYKDDPKDAEGFLNRHGNPYTDIGADPYGSVGSDLRVYATPTSLIIDSDGIIRYTFIGTINAESWNTLFLPRIQQYEHERSRRGR